MLTARLKGSFLDSVRAFKDDDYPRLLDVALSDVSRLRPRHVWSSLVVWAGQRTYECPADLKHVISSHWGRDQKQQRDPWAINYPVTRLPEMAIGYDPQGARVLVCVPSPDASLIAQLGAAFEYEYAANHILNETACSLTEFEQSLLIVRAQAEAMRELAMKHVTTPVQLKEGMTTSAANGTPTYLYGLLMDEFNIKVAM